MYGDDCHNYYKDTLILFPTGFRGEDITHIHKSFTLVWKRLANQIQEFIPYIQDCYHNNDNMMSERAMINDIPKILS